jgi:hypothetical protein
MAMIIKSDNVLRVEGMRVLIKYFGAVDAERFINNIKTEHFDYTKWQQGLWKDKTIDEIHKAATDYYNTKHGSKIS